MYRLYNWRNLNCVCILTILLVGCGRNAPSPVEIKINDAPEVASKELLINHDLGTDSTYIISRNETLFDVAYKYNIDAMNLAKINNIKPPYKVREGQKLKLPNESTEVDVETNKSTSMEIVSGDYPSSAMKEIPSYSDNDFTSNDLKKKLDEEFEEVILEKHKPGEEKKTSSSDKQAALLSVPKVTQSVNGAPTLKNSDKKVSSDKKTAASSTDTTKPVDPSSQKSSKMMWPVKGSVISKFGDIKDGVTNDGINIKAPMGTVVKSVADGVVIYSGDKLDEDYGKVVMIQHNNGLVTSYAHLNDISVKKDANVRAGDKIGSVGSTGDVQEPQLYFEVMKDKKSENPSKYLNK